MARVSDAAAGVAEPAGGGARPVLAARLRAQRLSGPPCTSPEQVVDALLAVQAQDERGMRLSVRARTVGVAASDIDAALTERRSLVVSWLNRGTLQLVAARDFWWLHALTAPQQMSSNLRRLRQVGVDESSLERGMGVVAEQVSLGPRTRAQLKVALDSAAVSTGGQALYHLLLAASLRGRVVQGPVRDGELCFVDVQDWLGAPPPPVAREEALEQLARRYLIGHGPATAEDLAAWGGIRLGDARAGLATLGDELGPGPGPQVCLEGQPAPAVLPGPRLLGPFEPLLHGWVSREFVLGSHVGDVTRGGLFRAFAMVEGRAVASWGLSAGVVTLQLLEQVPTSALEALLEDAARVQIYLGLPLKRARVLGSKLPG